MRKVAVYKDCTPGMNCWTVVFACLQLLKFFLIMVKITYIPPSNFFLIIKMTIITTVDFTSNGTLGLTVFIM